MHPDSEPAQAQREETRLDVVPARPQAAQEPSQETADRVGVAADEAHRDETSRAPDRAHRLETGRAPGPGRSKPEAPGCKEHCCNDGERSRDCFRGVESCAAEGPEKGKFAIVFSHVGGVPEKFLPYLEDARDQAKKGGLDLLLLIPRSDATSLEEGLRMSLKDRGVTVVEVDWALPPDMLYHQKDGWCAPEDLIKLHALTLSTYDAVVMYSNLVQIQGDLLPLLRCAATGRFLATQGGFGEPLNPGFFAVRPDKRLLQAAMIFAREATFAPATGWANGGYAPKEGYYVGAECGSGFLHTLLYKRGRKAVKLAQDALVRAGLDASGVQAELLDMCIWNYQTSSGCRQDFNCSRVIAHQLPLEKGSDPRECMKRLPVEKPQEGLLRNSGTGGGGGVKDKDVKAKDKDKVGCLSCCNDGQKYVRCLDVNSCAAAGPNSGRFALVLSYTGDWGDPLLPDTHLQYVESMRAFASRVSPTHEVEIILLVAKKEVESISSDIKDLLRELGVKLTAVDWATPPGMRYRAKGWCGKRDLLKLHALALEGYDAVAVYGHQVELQGDILPALRCAATGFLLSTQGDAGEPLNTGFFVVRPDKRLLEAAVIFGREANYTSWTGWAKGGFTPKGSYYLGAECGSGFLHTLFYKKSAPAKKAFQEANLSMPGDLKAQQLDMCEWNYQLSANCRRDFDCSRVIAHQRPSLPGSDPGECLKSDVPQALRKPRVEGPPGCLDCCNDGSTVVPCMSEGELEACAAQGPKDGKFAFVLTYTGVILEPTFMRGILPSIKTFIAANNGSTFDILLVMRKQDRRRVGNAVLQAINDQGVTLYTAAWDVPPDMRFFPKKGEVWCGVQDLVRLHALELPGYDAIAYFDLDIQIEGDVMPIFRCAATGRMLTTGGGIGEPLNVGFFAVRPDPRLMQASRIFARSADYSRRTGWGDSGFKPAQGEFPGSECGQGFFHTLFYKRTSRLAQRALKEAGLLEEGVFEASQLDLCVWNYQTDMRCHKQFDCARVRVHHKPNGKGPFPNQCVKRQLPNVGGVELKFDTNICLDCCNDGSFNVACLNVEACAAGGPSGGRFAIVLSYVGGEPPQKHFLRHLASVRAQASRGNGSISIEVLLLVAEEHAKLMPSLATQLERKGVKLKTVPWAIPPGMRAADHSGAWCGALEILALHALGLAEYDAVAYFGSDMELQGDVTPALRCAARGRLLTTAGGTGEPLNAAFFAARPDKRLLQAVVNFAQNASFSEKQGWAGALFEPKQGYWAGAECAAGFLHTLFYRTDAEAAQLALSQAGLSPGDLKAEQLDMCQWNYQGSSGCRKNFDCKLVRAHQRPSERGSDPLECRKTYVK